MVGGCGRPGASRGVLSYSLRSPLTEPPSVIDVAYWPRPGVRRSAATRLLSGRTRHWVPKACTAAPDPQETLQPAPGSTDMRLRKREDRMFARRAMVSFTRQPSDGRGACPRREMIAGLGGAAVCPMFRVRRAEQTTMIGSLNGSSPAPLANRLYGLREG